MIAKIKPFEDTGGLVHDLTFLQKYEVQTLCRKVLAAMVINEVIPMTLDYDAEKAKREERQWPLWFYLILFILPASIASYVMIGPFRPRTTILGYRCTRCDEWVNQFSYRLHDYPIGHQE